MRANGRVGQAHLHLSLGHFQHGKYFIFLQWIPLRKIGR